VPDPRPSGCLAIPSMGRMTSAPKVLPSRSPPVLDPDSGQAAGYIGTRIDTDPSVICIEATSGVAVDDHLLERPAVPSEKSSRIHSRSVSDC
jgi:hypothetical protein